MFVFSKIFWLIAQPSKLFWLLGLLSVLGICLPIGTTQLGITLQRLSKIILCLLFTILSVIVFFPVDDWLAHPLEQRFPQPSTLPENIAGMIILGGVFDQVLSERHGQVSVNGAIERVTEPLRLLKQYPDATIVFTGGTSYIKQLEVKEADVAKTFFEDMGVETNNFIFESASRNTSENALLTKDLLNPTENQTWLLVTSASHMPRSVGIFRKAGWNILPYPVDYNSNFPEPHPGSQLGGKIGNIDRFSKEWFGLFAYRLLGRTNSFFPSPE